MNLKHLLISTAVSFAMGIATVQADPRHHAGQGQMNGQAASSPGMGMMDMDRMHDQMQIMRETMDRAHKTDDPDKRRQLMQQHMTQMHDMMGNMRGMMGPGMMTPAEVKGKMDGGQMGGASMDERHQMMERRMDVMQQMMEQMMEQMMLQHRGRMNQ